MIKNNTFSKFKTNLKFGNQNTIFCASMVIKYKNSFKAFSLYERVDTPNILSCFVVDRPRPEYGLPVAVI